MHCLATTRFNTDTWNENKRWRGRNQWNGCVYGTPVRIADKYTPNIYMFILEMHNDKNKIKGIGLIRNALVIGEYHNIYSDGNYNRFTYKSKHRIDRRELAKEDKYVIRVLDALVFKGARHLKRGQGINVVPTWVTANGKIDFIGFFCKLFRSYSSLK